MAPFRSAKICAAAAVFTVLPALAMPDVRQCTGSVVSVAAESADHAELTCDVVAQASALFAACAIPAITAQLHIDIVDDLQAEYLGVYHYDENLIEVLTPQALQSRREPDAALSYLGPEAHFKSLIVHELTHAATDGTPCPFEDCITMTEYIAYAMQLMSLDNGALSTFEQDLSMDHPITTEALNTLVLYMAPDVFAGRVWAHFNQQNDPCVFMDRLVSGKVYLGMEELLLP